ncbi:unnamed protein product [Alopecurus aequalis]
MAGVMQLCVVAVSCVLLTAVSASPSQPKVITVSGEARGWRQPTPGEETYNYWASRNRFHKMVSSTEVRKLILFIYFRYAMNDSVLLVTRDDYKLCRGDRPALRLDGGEEARFRLERSGILYFISGALGHCDGGQRITVRVMAQHDAGGGFDAVAPALSPGGGPTTPGSGAVPKTPPRGKAGDGKTSGAPAPVGGYHAVALLAPATCRWGGPNHGVKCGVTS